ncbi:MFS transporter, partial [Parendozoicomonas haliclonae]
MRNKASIGSRIQSLSLFVAVILQGAGQTALLVCLPLLSQTTGISYSMLTMALSVGMVMVFFAAPFWGDKSDRIGRKTVIRAGLIAMVVGYVLLAAAILLAQKGVITSEGALGIIVVSRLVYGAFVGGLYPTVQAAVMDQASKEHGARALGSLSAAMNIGRLVGPLFGFVAVHFGVVVMCLVLAVTPLLLMIMLGHGRQFPSAAAPATGVRPASLLGIVKWGAPVFFIAVLLTAIFGALQLIVGPLMSWRLDLSPAETTEQLSWLMLTLSLITVLTYALFTRFIGQRYPLFIKTGATLLLVGCFLLIQLEGGAGIWLGLSLAAVSVMLMTPAYTALLSGKVPAERGRITGVLSMMHSG